MKVLFDAHLPRSLARLWVEMGMDVRHTLNLENGNASTDQQVMQYADLESRIVVTKDADFVDSHVLNGRPRQLLLISTGNIKNRDLAELLVLYLPQIELAFQDSSFVELSRTGLIVHG